MCVGKAVAEPWPERPAAKRHERKNWRSAKGAAIWSLSARRFAEPWPERPAAKRHEREKWRSAKMGSDPVCVGKAVAEPWPERPAAKRHERENGSISVETTGHQSVRRYGANPVVASFTANAATIRTTNPRTTKAVNGRISATIALRGSANRARSGLCRRRPFAEPWPERLQSSALSPHQDKRSLAGRPRLTTLD